MTLVRVNGGGDLAMNGDLRPVIGQVVELKRERTKKGFAEVSFEGQLYYVPPKNISPIEASE